VPRSKKNFFKFWWNQELDALELQSITACRHWKESGKRRSGSVFDEYRSAKASYRLAIRSYQQDDTAFYTNDLHESLVNKRGSSFWKCCKSKFDTKNRTISHIDGTTIVQKFVEHLSSACSPLSQAGSSNLRNVYTDMRPSYTGNPLSNKNIH